MIYINTDPAMVKVKDLKESGSRGPGFELPAKETLKLTTRSTGKLLPAELIIDDQALRTRI
jgi:hypothetical protein